MIRTIASGRKRLSRPRALLETIGTKADTRRDLPNAWVIFSTGVSSPPSFPTAIVSVWPGMARGGASGV